MVLPGVTTTSSSIQETEDYSQVEMDRMGKIFEENNDIKNNLICLIYGTDGTSKTGLTMSYLIKEGKRTLYLDIDGNSKGLLTNVYENNKLIRLINPRKTELKYNKKYKITTPEIDYKATLNEIRLWSYWAEQNHDKIDAVVVDGASTLLYYAEQQMRLDKNIDLDGSVSMKYWLNRNKMFLDTIDLFRNIPNIDLFLIGHENFIVVPGTKSISMGGELVKIGNTSSVVEKTNRMMDQRIYLELNSKDGNYDPNKEQDYEVIATIHKWRNDSDKVLNKFVLLDRKEGKTTWHDETIENIFKSKEKEEDK